MTATNMAKKPEIAAVLELRAGMQGRVVLPGDASYSTAKQIWNGAVDCHPALIALCETPTDVQIAIRVARRHHIPLSVRGGGHDWVGRALRHKGLVIDLSNMRHVEIDARNQFATVAGGATAGDLISAAAPHGLVAVTGTVGAVGMAGLTLGGGYGPFIGRYGLALDNLLGAELVLADGRLVKADASENAELYWALRGGGGNFGAVTSMRIRLHPTRDLLAGVILFPWSEAEKVLHAYAEAVTWAPDELTVSTGVLSAPNGDPLLFLAPTWSGERVRGDQVMAGLQSLGTPMLVQIGPMTSSDILSMFDAYVVNGRHYALQTRWVSALTSSVISSLIAAGSTRTSPFTAIALHHFHGAATRIPLDATAFGLRREHFLVEIIAAWEPDAQKDHGTVHRQWAQTISQTLAPLALPGGYANLLGPDNHDQIEQAYGGNIVRLRDVKRRFDPDGIFTSAIALPN